MTVIDTADRWAFGGPDELGDAMKPALLVLLVLACGAVCSPGPSIAADCATEAAALEKEQADLPRLEFTTPADRPPYCITLETLMVFAARVKAHVAHCPNSDYVQRAAEWEKNRTAYGKLFGQYRCKRTM